MVLGLKVSQSPVRARPLLVHTLDISSSGARIGALPHGIQPGSLVVVQRMQHRAVCSVIWSREIVPGEIQIGIEFLQGGAQFWELDLDEGCAGIWTSASAR